MEQQLPRREIENLKTRLEHVEAQLNALQRRLAVFEGRPSPGVPVAVVDPEECVGCGLCEDICSIQAIFVDLKAVVDQTQCIGCGQCAAECPQNAISLESRSSEPHPAAKGRR